LSYDIIIRNGKVYDGLSIYPRILDIAIDKGRISVIGNLSGEKGEVEIDASRFVVCPGFIDMHSHSDVSVLVYPESSSKVRQGVTTEVVGNCGLSPGPIKKESLELIKGNLDLYFSRISDLIDWNWETLSEYYRIVEKCKTAVNLIPLVGHNTLRINVMGFEARETSEEEIAEMKKMLERELGEGIWGMSSGLFYTPGAYSKTEEIIELAKVVKKYNALYFSHIRDEGRNVVEAIDEAIRIGRDSGVSVQISHIKVMGKAQWGLSGEIIEMIERARQEGIDIHADIYPYDAGQTSMLKTLPAWAQEGGPMKSLERLKDDELAEKIREEMEEGKMKGQNFVYELGWDNIIIVSTESGDEEVEGKNIYELGKIKGKRPFDVFREILIKNNGNVSIVIRGMNEQDIISFLKRDWVYIGTDQKGIRPGYGPLGGKQHPRAYGTFPRVLRRYVMEKNVLGLGEAISKMTGKPAMRLGLKNRGILKEGNYADIVVFNPEKIQDRATYENPNQYPEGIEYVIINGKVAVKKGHETGVKSGKVLRKNQS
jgi:N-acyl-D-aspartate/D-glutamate deacylase